MTDYNIATPASTESPRGGDDAIRATKAANQEINNINHYWPLNGNSVDHADKGKHRYCQFVDTMVSGSFTDKSLAVTSGEDALVFKGTQDEVELVMSSDALQSGSLCLDGGILRNDKKLQFINTSGDALVDMVAIESYLASGDVTKDRIIVSDGLRVDGEVCMSGNLITAVADPISDQDAATKAYVDSHLQYVTETEGTLNTLITTDTAIISKATAFGASKTCQIILGFMIGNYTGDNDGGSVVLTIKQGTTTLWTGTVGWSKYNQYSYRTITCVGTVASGATVSVTATDAAGDSTKLQNDYAPAQLTVMALG